MKPKRNDNRVIRVSVSTDHIEERLNEKLGELEKYYVTIKVINIQIYRRDDLDYALIVFETLV